MQKTRYSEERGFVLQDGSSRAADEDVKVISGVDLLTNNQVSRVLTDDGGVLICYEG
jgi:hypothetical protein